MAGKRNTLTISDLRESLPEIVHRTLAFGESFTVTKHGIPFAKIEPITNKDELQQIQRELKAGKSERSGTKAGGGKRTVDSK
jgi:antitoxin (DNA-binding transcriptional repressor) of toxin-antitoxin stability system